MERMTRRAKPKRERPPEPVRMPPKKPPKSAKRQTQRAVVAEVVEPQVVTAIAVREPVTAVRLPPIGALQDDIMVDWLEAKSDDTRRCYLQWLAKFVEWLREQALTSKLKDGDAIIELLAQGPARANWVFQRWVNAMVGSGIPRTTYAKHYAAVRSFSSALLRSGRAAFVPSAQLPKIERPDALERLQKYAGVPEGYKKLVAALERLAKGKGAKPIDVRDWALVRSLRGMGLRRIEMFRANAEDVDIEQRFTKVIGKGRRRHVRQPMGRNTAAALRLWLKVRERAVGSATGPLWVALVGEVGRRLERGTYNAIITRRCRELGIAITPHDLRRIYSTDAIDRFGHRRAKDLTRHVNVATLEIYDLEAGRDLQKMADEADEDT